MASIAIQQIKEAGLDATYSAADVAGDDFINSGNEFIHVKNGSASAITVTIPAQNTNASIPKWGALTKGNISVSIAAGSDEFIGKIPTVAFNNSSRKAIINYSSVTSVSVAVLKL